MGTALLMLAAFVAGAVVMALLTAKEIGERGLERDVARIERDGAEKDKIALRAHLAEAVLDAGRSLTRANLATARAETAETSEPALRESLKRARAERDEALGRVVQAMKALQGAAQGP